ncbi:hypothetical protein QOL99_06695 [Deinococcus sp. MIMF12]|uniref:Uncharacterized protein n=1 Tax=Deinococcus rhizophilus TaxID=3049544 RepID=A0ABT7JH55_9DEIO|nr:hypothetical protein [Deinococcus rhizophilus]MDL2343835.1 hypothetical protein [Deinococcus rhizophilus]
MSAPSPAPLAARLSASALLPGRVLALKGTDSAASAEKRRGPPAHSSAPGVVRLGGT